MKQMKLLLFLTALLIAMTIQAQEKWIVSFSGGASIPLGEFGKDAGIGPSFAVDINREDSSHLKLVFSIRHINNSFLSHDRAFSQNFHNYRYNVSPTFLGDYHFSGDSWQSTGIFAGGKPSYSISQNLQFSMLLQFGVLLNQSPEMELTLIEGATDNSGTIGSTFSTSLAFVAGIGFDYQLSDRWYCHLNSHYFSSNALYDVKLNTNRQEQIDNLRIKQWLQTLQCTAGVGFKF